LTSMNLIGRAKGILTNPKGEWAVIAAENAPVVEILVPYLLVFALVPTLGKFVGYGLIGYKIPFIGYVSGIIGTGIAQGVVSFISTVAGALLMAYVIDILAPLFLGTRNFSKAFELIVYAYTPVLMAGIFYVVPSVLGVLVLLTGTYSLYLFYVGVKPMMQIPDDKVAGYFIVSFVVVITIAFVVSLILGTVFLSSSLIGAEMRT